MEEARSKAITRGGGVVVWAVVLIAGALAGELGREAVQVSVEQAGCSSKREISDAELQEVAAKLNARIPMRIDAYTRLERVEASSGARIAYNYVLDGQVGSAADRERLANYLMPKLISEGCSTDRPQGLAVSGVTVTYNYRLDDETEVGRYVVTPRDCH